MKSNHIHKCYRCQETDTNKFSKNRNKKSGLSTYCKSCTKILKHESYLRCKSYYQKKNKQYYETHKEECLKQSKQWSKDNPERHAELKRNWAQNNPDYIIKYHQENKEEISQQRADYHQRRLTEDVNYRLVRNLRKRINVGIKRHLKRNPNNPRIKTGSAVSDLGCSIVELKMHLESQFYPHPIAGTMMSWDNYGNGPMTWQIDHIKELRSFDLNNRSEFLDACNYMNLQPLWFEDHIIKTTKFKNLDLSI